jgi:hypothetical protein
MVPMQAAQKTADGLTIYESNNLHCHTSGLQGYTVRILPFHADLLVPFIPGLIVWA